MSERELREAFGLFDSDGNGTIDLNELKQMVRYYFEAAGERPDSRQVDYFATQIMRACDVNGDGEISFEEFIRAFRTN